MERRQMLGALAAGTLGFGLAPRLGSAEASTTPANPNPHVEYNIRTFLVEAGLPGLSPEMLGEHVALYKGYVNRTNTLLKDLQSAEAEAKTTTAVQESRRRLGFEFSGMRLHELYFEALKAKASPPSLSHPLIKSIITTWGSFEAWWGAFKTTCTMTGIGWGALVKDPLTGRLMNAWLQDHENAVAVGTIPILVVDVWEHAYVKDYGAAARAKYVDAIKPLIDWRVVEKRY